MYTSDVLAQKLVNIRVFFTIFHILKFSLIFMNIQIQKSDHVIKCLYLCFNLVPRLVVWTAKQLQYGCFCRFTPVQENSIIECHVNHAFKHSQIKLFPGDNFLGPCQGSQ